MNMLASRFSKRSRLILAALRQSFHSGWSDNLPQSVRIVEVGPRDGLQNEKKQIPAATKIRFIDMLSATGLQSVEATSFVSPKAVPQLADAPEVFQGIQKRQGVRYPVLVPNMKGLDKAIENGASEVAVFLSASEAFNQKNLGCSIPDSVAKYQDIARKAHDAGMAVRGYISVVAGCPYQGKVDAKTVARIARQLKDMGCYEVSLGDTIGVATPKSLHNLLQACQEEKLPVSELAVHLHDTYGQAVANICMALQMGVSVIDSSVAGLGGCPFAPGATGNVATEDCIFLLDGLGISHGVDREKLAAASSFILGELGMESHSRAGRATAAAEEARARAAAKAA